VGEAQAATPDGFGIVKQGEAVAAVDGQAITITTQEQALARVFADVAARRPFTLFTLNLDHLVKRRRDASFRAAYARARHVTADGHPVARLARRQDARVQQVTGSDLFLPLLSRAAAERMPVALFGASPDSLALAVERLASLCPGLVLAHAEAPPFGFDPLGAEAGAAAARIAQSGARLVVVALGAPKQELFSDRLAREHGLGALAIGASIDFVSGAQVRAPAFLTRNGLEWLWRLAHDPRRLAARYAACALLLVELLLNRNTTTGGESRA
jgi:exopolysaccharide biosynthesis WecB/TagA/CpsF family protein